jgi:hypothetical protein
MGALTCSLVGSSCDPFGFPEDRPRTVPFGQDGAPTFGDAEGTEEADANLCPARPPAPGEACPDHIDVVRCTFEAATCTHQGLVYRLYEDYCCFLQTWRKCGSNTTPCMKDAGADSKATGPDRDISPDGRGESPDAGINGPDGGVDAGSSDGADTDNAAIYDAATD